MLKHLVLALGALAALQMTSGPSGAAVPFAPPAANWTKMHGALSIQKIAYKPYRVRQILQDAGYRNIRFIDRELPDYKVEACRGIWRFQLTLNDFGEIRRRRLRGLCRARRGEDAPRVEAAIRPGDLRGLLYANGYVLQRIARSRPTRHVVIACARDTRYRLRIRARDAKIIRSVKVGNCNTPEIPTLTQQDLQGFLMADGTSLIRVRRKTSDGGFVVVGCRYGVRKRIALSRWGGKRGERELGSCLQRLRPLRGADLSGFFFADDAILVDVIRSNRRVHVAEICRGGQAYRVRVRRRDHTIRRQRGLGACVVREFARLSKDDMRGYLVGRGFVAPKFVRQRGDLAVMRGCQGDKRLRLEVTPYGRIQSRREIGRCRVRTARRAPTMSRKELRDLLYSRGFALTSIEEARGEQYVATACKRGVRFRLTVDSEAGAISSRKRIGSCEDTTSAPRLAEAEIRRLLDNRGYDRIRIIERLPRATLLEACRNVRRFRLRVSNDGTIRRRKPIGWCSRTARAPARRVIAPRRITVEEISSDEPIDPSDCQDYFDWVLSKDKVYFDRGSAKVRDDSRRLLNRLARIARRCPAAKITIGGHTDADGSNELNLKLSNQRAASVARYLTQRGVANNRLLPIGYGEEHPVAANDTPGNKALNRRIEFVVEWE